MMYITLIAVAAILLLEFSGAVPRSSVGGPMTIALVLLIAAFAVGIQDAWAKGRGVLGWILSIIISLVGAFLAASLGGMIMEPLLMALDPEGPLAETRGPLLYGVSAGLMLLTLLGSWLALKIFSRWR